jgi:hypothetical protein
MGLKWVFILIFIPVSLGHVGVWRSVGNLPAKCITSVERILGEELIKSSGELTYMCSVWGFPAPTEFLSDITCYPGAHYFPKPAEHMCGRIKFGTYRWTGRYPCSHGAS